MSRLKGKHALVTGGAQGLGFAIGKMFAQHGAAVMLTDLDGEAARQAAASLSADGSHVQALQQDVTSESHWPEVVRQTAEQLGGLDVLVNNAGIGLFANVEETTADIWRQTMAVNLDAVFMGTQAGIGHMKDHGGGSIINMSSIEGIVGDMNLAAYNASKGACAALPNPPRCTVRLSKMAFGSTPCILPT